jgi:hypothetical protein
MDEHKNIDFIEDAERRAGGVRWDDTDNPAGFYTLLASVARAMGRNPHNEHDDYAVGMLISQQIQDEMSGESARKRASDNMFASLLMAGISPDTLGEMFGKKRW